MPNSLPLPRFGGQPLIHTRQSARCTGVRLVIWTALPTRGERVCNSRVELAACRDDFTATDPGALDPPRQRGLRDLRLDRRIDRSGHRLGIEPQISAG